MRKFHPTIFRLARGADAGRPPATAPATGAVLGTGGLLARGVPLGAEGGLEFDGIWGAERRQSRL